MANDKLKRACAAHARRAVQHATARATDFSPGKFLSAGEECKQPYGAILLYVMPSRPGVYRKAVGCLADKEGRLLAEDFSEGLYGHMLQRAKRWRRDGPTQKPAAPRKKGVQPLSDFLRFWGRRAVAVVKAVLTGEKLPADPLGHAEAPAAAPRTAEGPAAEPLAAAPFTTTEALDTATPATAQGPVAGVLATAEAPMAPPATAQAPPAAAAPATTGDPAALPAAMEAPAVGAAPATTGSPAPPPAAAEAPADGPLTAAAAPTALAAPPTTEALAAAPATTEAPAAERPASSWKASMCNQGAYDPDWRTWLAVDGSCCCPLQTCMAARARLGFPADMPFVDYTAGKFSANNGQNEKLIELASRLCPRFRSEYQGAQSQRAAEERAEELLRDAAATARAVAQAAPADGGADEELEDDEVSGGGAAGPSTGAVRPYDPVALRAAFETCNAKNKLSELRERLGFRSAAALRQALDAEDLAWRRPTSGQARRMVEVYEQERAAGHSNKEAIAAVATRVPGGWTALQVRKHIKESGKLQRDKAGRPKAAGIPRAKPAGGRGRRRAGGQAAPASPNTASKEDSSSSGTEHDSSSGDETEEARSPVSSGSSCPPSSMGGSSLSLRSSGNRTGAAGGGGDAEERADVTQPLPGAAGLGRGHGAAHGLQVAGIPAQGAAVSPGRGALAGVTDSAGRGVQGALRVRRGVRSGAAQQAGSGSVSGVTVSAARSVRLNRGSKMGNLLELLRE